MAHTERNPYEGTGLRGDANLAHAWSRGYTTGRGNQISTDGAAAAIGEAIERLKKSQNILAYTDHANAAEVSCDLDAITAALVDYQETLETTRE